MAGKFQPGDLVRIAKNLGVAARYLHADVEAIIEYSYAGKYGGKEHNSYSVFIRNIGKASWYDANQLTLIESSRIDLLDEWKGEINHKPVFSIQG